MKSLKVADVKRESEKQIDNLDGRILYLFLGSRQQEAVL